MCDRTHKGADWRQAVNKPNGNTETGCNKISADISKSDTEK
jgi:hypothetical protein